MSIRESANGRLVTIVLTKGEVFQKEMEIYRQRSNEIFRKHSPYTIQKAHNVICWENHDEPTVESKMVE